MGWLQSIRRMKKESGLTTSEIAERSGIPEPTLEKVFSGATKSPKLTTIQELVRFFGYTLDDLDGDKKKPSDVKEYTPEGKISLEESNRLLVSLGYLKEGEDLSDADLQFLAGIIKILDVWFGERR